MVGLADLTRTKKVQTKKRYIPAPYDGEGETFMSAKQFADACKGTFCFTGPLAIVMTLRKKKNEEGKWVQVFHNGQPVHKLTAYVGVQYFKSGETVDAVLVTGMKELTKLKFNEDFEGEETVAFAYPDGEKATVWTSYETLDGSYFLRSETKEWEGEEYVKYSICPVCRNL